MSEASPKATEREARVMQLRREHFAGLIARERLRQDEKWGVNVVPAEKMVAILGEEYGEVCRAVCDSWPTMSTAVLQNLEDELVQVAAVASKFYELLHVLEQRRTEAAR